jgi:hypothetical protein
MAGLLTRFSFNVFPTYTVSDLRILKSCYLCIEQQKQKLTAAGTVADLHGIPF